MKKVLAVVITVIMLMSLCGMQSFAFTVKLPTVTGVESVAGTSVSMKALDNSKKNTDDYIAYVTEELGISIEELREHCEELFGESFEDMFYSFQVSDILALTLSDGSEVEIDTDLYYEIDRYTKINVNAHVTYDDYLTAKQENADTVNVTVDCEVYSYISGISKDSSFVIEAELVDCFVKDFTPVSVIDYSLYEDSDELDLEGKKFLVTHADGTAKTYTAKFDAAEESFMLNGEDLYVWFDDDKVTIEYMDEFYEHSVSFDGESPYESIEIVDYELSETEGLTSVTYEITDNKGNSKSFTADMTPYLEEGSLYPEYYYSMVDAYDSYGVYVCCDEYIDYDSALPVVSAMELYVSMGDLYSESVEIEYYTPTEEEKDILTVIEDIIAGILTAFFNILSFFDIEPVI